MNERRAKNFLKVSIAASILMLMAVFHSYLTEKRARTMPADAPSVTLAIEVNGDSLAIGQSMLFEVSKDDTAFRIITDGRDTVYRLYR